MKFIYGANDWKTIERGQENCYLVTNGLGGYSSTTIIGSSARNDHSVFMASKKAPNDRRNLIHHMEEWIEIGQEKVYLSTQQYDTNKKEENGYLVQTAFDFEDYPKWTYFVDGIEVQKSLCMRQGENTIVLFYEIQNYSEKDGQLFIKPYVQFAKKGEDMGETKQISKNGNCLSSSDMAMYFWTNGVVSDIVEEKENHFFYEYDECDGRRKTGTCIANHMVQMNVKKKEKVTLALIYSTEPNAVGQEDIVCYGQEIFRQEVDYRAELVKISGLQNEIAQMLVKSANQYLSKRESTGGDTILAGFPFFEDWGRDTMIALYGCCLSTNQVERAKNIFRTFMMYCKKGLMPNLFPEGDNAPLYNTVDASLLFINAVYEYYKRTKDKAFIIEIYPVMEDIVNWYQKGTDFSIFMDQDGLISAGAGYDQVTWMDVRIDTILPTPRHGKPVEINAYWYSSLCIMKEFATLLNKKQEQIKTYEELAKKVKTSFCRQFWNEQTHCLKDVLVSDGEDKNVETQIRLNQIWAISMPFTMLSEEQEKQVVDKVMECLYTPYGLRSLGKGEKEFQGKYGGSQVVRDLAYHQGTVWTFPLGAYYLAYLKVHKYSKEAKDTVLRQLSVIESAMREGCVGQLPEIYDGLRPTRSQGCFAQAWSVGEILRVHEQLEKN